MNKVIVSNEASEGVARMLIQAGAVKFSPLKPYQWASGWLSPVYCDNRITLSFPEIRSALRSHLADAVKEHFPDAESIAGVATAGIPQGTLVAEALHLPFLYVRSKPKGHGLENLIEGRVVKGQKVAVIEDLVSTGSSSLSAIEALRRAGMKPKGLTCIFTYSLSIAEKNFDEAGIQLVALTDYNHLLKEALVSGQISEDTLKTLKAWHVDPAGWKPE